MSEISGIEFVKRIDILLNEIGKTRKEFAKQINVSPSTISTWKTKNIIPPVETVFRISEILNVSINWLITGNDFYNIKAVDATELQEKYICELLKFNHLSNKRKKIIKDLLEELS